MKYFLILVTALLLIAAGGAGGYFVFQKTAVASAGALTEVQKAEKQARELAAMKAKEQADLLRFVELDPIVLPIVDAQGVSQVVTLVISLEVIGDENAELASKMTPRLKDAYIQHLYGVLSRKASMEGGVIKVDDLKKRLTKVSAKVLGDHKVNNVLLQVVNQRSI